MVLLIRITLFLLAAASVVGAVLYLRRSWGARTIAIREAYNVARLNARRIMLNNVYKATGLGILAVIFLVAGLIYPAENREESVAPAAVDPPHTEPAGSPTPATEAVLESNTSPSPTPLPTATVMPSPALPETPSAPPTVTPEPTVELERAFVNSPVVGLYLRTAPNGEIVERLDDQTELVLLGDEQTVEGLLWVRVETPSGNEGWVASDFLRTEQPLSTPPELEATSSPVPENG